MARRLPPDAPGRPARDKRSKRHGHRDAAKPSNPSVSGPLLQLNNIARRNIEQKVQCFSSDQLLARFHDLVGKRLAEPLKLLEALELEMIEARLDSEERAEVDRVTEFHKTWDGERSALLASIERLVAGLREE